MSELSDALVALWVEERFEEGRELLESWEGVPNDELSFRRALNALLGGEPQAALEHYAAAIEFCDPERRGLFCLMRAQVLIDAERFREAQTEVEYAIDAELRHYNYCRRFKRSAAKKGLHHASQPPMVGRCGFCAGKDQLFLYRAVLQAELGEPFDEEELRALSEVTLRYAIGPRRVEVLLDLLRLGESVPLISSRIISGLGREGRLEDQKLMLDQEFARSCRGGANSRSWAASSRSGGLCIAYSEAGLWEKALAECEKKGKWSARYPRSHLCGQRAGIFLAVGRLREALSELSNAIELTPLDPPGLQMATTWHLERGFVRLKLGDIEGARADAAQVDDETTTWLDGVQSRETLVAAIAEMESQTG